MLSLVLKKKPVLKAVVNYHKLIEHKPADIWNGNKRIKQAASQIGCKTLTVKRLI